MRKLNKKAKVLVVALAALVIALAAYAATPVPNIFENDTLADATKVNANFQDLVDKITALESQITAASQFSIRDSTRDLVVQNNTTNSTTQMDVSASEIILKESSGNAVLLQNVSFTADITQFGQGGLDTGSETVSTWYHIWVIHYQSLGTTAGLLSASATSPTLPSGFSFKAYLGSVFNDSSSDFISLFQKGKEVVVTSQLATSTLVGSLTQLSLSTFVPTTAVKVSGRVITVGTTRNVITIASSSTSLGEVQIVDVSGGELSGGMYSTVMVTPQTIYYNTLNLSQGQIFVSGWTY